MVYSSSFDIVDDVVHASIVAHLEASACEYQAKVVGVGTFWYLIVESHV
mgnify:CR=1 FL=1